MFSQSARVGKALKTRETRVSEGRGGVTIKEYTDFRMLTFGLFYFLQAKIRYFATKVTTLNK